MNPWEENLTVIESTPSVMPWEEELVVETPRGANLAGAIRNIAQATPWLGTSADEAEGLVRALIRGENFEKWRKNAEESALGNIKNTKYGRALEIGTNLAENAVLAGLTGGLTLTPPISAAQGAVEGFGKGRDLGERTALAGIGAGMGAVIPAALNRVLPTQTTQRALINQLTKSKDALKSVVAKALQQGTTPEEIIAKEVPKGLRPDLWANIRRSSVGENVLRKATLDQAADTVSKPYAQYITEEISKVSPKYASKIGNKIEKLKLDELGEDVVGELDPRQYVMDAVNDAMQGATAEEKALVGEAVSNAVAKRGVAKKLTNVTVERPISNSSGSIWSFARRAVAPIRNIANKGLMRGMTVGTTNYVPDSLAGRLMNFYTPNPIRGLIDAIVEKQQLESLK